MIVENDASAAWLWPRCAVATTLTAAELSGLLVLRERLGAPPQTHVACELAAGHDQMHAAFVIADDGGDRWWWIRWNAQGRNLSHLQICHHADEPTGDDCLLPATHPGRHSFQM